MVKHIIYVMTIPCFRGRQLWMCNFSLSIWVFVCYCKALALYASNLKLILANDVRAVMDTLMTYHSFYLSNSLVWPTHIFFSKSTWLLKLFIFKRSRACSVYREYHSTEHLHGSLSCRKDYLLRCCERPYWPDFILIWQTWLTNFNRKSSR